MARERGEPAILDTSKPIIEPPVFPDYPQNTQQTRSVADDPDLFTKDDDEEDEDLDEDIDDTVNDEFEDDDVAEVAEPTVFKDEEFLDEDDEDDDF